MSGIFFVPEWLRVRHVVRVEICSNTGDYKTGYAKLPRCWEECGGLLRRGEVGVTAAAAALAVQIAEVAVPT